MIDGKRGKNEKNAREIARKGKKEVGMRLHDVILVVDCAMELTLRMQNFSTPDGDRFFMTSTESRDFFMRRDSGPLFESHGGDF